MRKASRPSLAAWSRPPPTPVLAVKLNTAYFEVLGAAGWAALERVRAAIPAGPIVVLDAKRGDIGPSAERYAEALMGNLAADAVTLQPYLGEDAIEPFLAYPGRLVYVLARTSNPSAGRLQDLATGDGSLSTAVARWVAEQWPDGRAGIVVGATEPAELERLRAEVPTLGFLVPGVGAQGGDLAAAVRCCDGSLAPGLVNVSRGIAEAATGLGLARCGRRGGPAVAGRSPKSGCYTRRHQLRSDWRNMPQIGPMELIIVLVIILIIFGPGRLPDIGNAIGKGLREFRKASTEIEDSIRGEPKSPDTTPKS